MRDLIVALVLLGLMPSCFKKPFLGLLLFSLLAYMRLQDLTWSFARNVRWSFYVAIVMFLGYFAGNESRRFMANDIRNAIMIAMALLIGVSIALSGDANVTDAPKYVEYLKIVTIAMFTTGLVDSRERLRALIWVIAGSFAFYGLKNGVFGILSGGTPITRGPGGMLKDNNDFALALAMGVPMMLHIALSERREIFRRAMLASVPLTIVSIALTHSRGGFLALSTGISILVWRSRNRVAGFSMMLLLVLGGVLLAPQSYRDRLSTLSNAAEEDGSAKARLAAWRTAAVMIADKPIFGVGFDRFQANYKRYDPAIKDTSLEEHGSHVAHNSYLQIWAECGTPTFVLYMVLILISFLDVWKVRSLASRRFHSSWILNYCTMFEASMATFMIGSTFLNRAHFDLFYHWVAVILCFGRIARRELEDVGHYPVRELGVGRGVLRPAAPAGFGGKAAPAGGFGERPALGGGL